MMSRDEKLKLLRAELEEANNWRLVSTNVEWAEDWIARTEAKIKALEAREVPIREWPLAAVKNLWKALRAFAILMVLCTGAQAATIGGIPMDEKERSLIIQTMLGEGAGEGLGGMVAIAETIRNRAAQRGLSPSQVVLQPKQYSFWNDPDAARKWLEQNADPRAYQIASHAYEQAFNEGSQLTGGATHYYNPKAVKKQPSFAKTYERKGKIGNHEFFYGR